VPRPSNAPAATNKKPGEKLTEAEKRSIRRFKKLYDAALNALPDKASHAAEIDWIRNHPKMTELDRSNDKNIRLILDHNDIKRPPHGPAPSKAAVHALQHWCNRPDEFYRQMMSEQKKMSVGKDGDVLASNELSQEIKDIDALLLALDGAVQPDTGDGDEA
jgi:hypothetical protein